MAILYKCLIQYFDSFYNKKGNISKRIILVTCKILAQHSCNRGNNHFFKKYPRNIK